MPIPVPLLPAFLPSAWRNLLSPRSRVPGLPFSFWGGRHEPRPLEDQVAWGGDVPPMSPPYPRDQNGLGRGKMALEPSKASRNAVSTSEAPPPNKIHSRDPGRRLSPLCAGPRPPQPPRWTGQPPGPAAVDHLRLLQESLPGEDGLGAPFHGRSPASLSQLMSTGLPPGRAAACGAGGGGFPWLGPSPSGLESLARC